MNSKSNIVYQNRVIDNCNIHLSTEFDKGFNSSIEMGRNQSANQHSSDDYLIGSSEKKHVISKFSVGLDPKLSEPEKQTLNIS